MGVLFAAITTGVAVAVAAGIEAGVFRAMAVGAGVATGGGSGVSWATATAVGAGVAAPGLPCFAGVPMAIGGITRINSGLVGESAAAGVLSWSGAGVPVCKA
jgi:hypothetical protein